MSDTQLDIAIRPRRIFTVEEANRLLPTIESIFQEIDTKSSRATEVSDLLGDLEAYWGESVTEPSNEDHAEYARLQRELAATLQELNGAMARLNDVGCELKDPNRGLVDFYAYVDGELAYLCWQRVEKEISFWHTLDGGFAARKPLPR